MQGMSAIRACRHLHQRNEEHKGSAIGNHLKEGHDIAPDDIAQFFLNFKKVSEHV